MEKPNLYIHSLHLVIRMKKTIFYKMSCAHSYCAIEKEKKTTGFAPIKPNGLPWSTKLLRAYPGQKPLVGRETEETKAESKFCENLLMPKEDRDQVCDQLKFFLRVVCLANDLKDGRYEEEPEEPKPESTEREGMALKEGEETTVETSAPAEPPTSEPTPEESPTDPPTTEEPTAEG